MPFNCSGYNYIDDCNINNIDIDNCIQPSGGRIRFIMFIKKKYSDLVCLDPFNVDLYLNLICNNYAYIIPNVRGSLDGGSENIVNGYGDLPSINVNHAYTLTYNHIYIEEYSRLYDVLKNNTDFDLFFTTGDKMWYVDGPVRINPTLPITDETTSIIEMVVILSWLSKKLPVSLPLLNIFKTTQCLYDSLKNHTCTNDLLPYCPPLPPRPPACPIIINLIYNNNDVTITLNVFDPTYNYSYSYNNVETLINTNPFTFTYLLNIDTIIIKRNGCPDLTQPLNTPTCCGDGISLPELTATSLDYYLQVDPALMVTSNQGGGNVYDFDLVFDIEVIMNNCCQDFYQNGGKLLIDILPVPGNPNPIGTQIYTDYTNPTNGADVPTPVVNPSLIEIKLDCLAGPADTILNFLLRIKGCCDESAFYTIPTSIIIDYAEPIAPPCCPDTSNFSNFNPALADIFVTNVGGDPDGCLGKTVTFQNINVWCPNLIMRITVANGHIFDPLPPQVIHYNSGLINPPLPLTYTTPVFFKPPNFLYPVGFNVVISIETFCDDNGTLIPLNRYWISRNTPNWDWNLNSFNNC